MVVDAQPSLRPVLLFRYLNRGKTPIAMIPAHAIRLINGRAIRKHESASTANRLTFIAVSTPVEDSVVFTISSEFLVEVVRLASIPRLTLTHPGERNR
jgi:hypothetical protein